MADVVELIKLQHRQIDDLLGQAEQAEPDALPGLLRQVAELLIPHSEAEEALVYPAIRDHDQGEAEDVEDGLAEHHHVEDLMKQLIDDNPSTPGFEGKLAAMIGELRHHVEEEESTLLPVLSEQADDAERAELGARFAELTEQPGEQPKGQPKGQSKGQSKAQSKGQSKEQPRGQSTGQAAGDRSKEELYLEAKEKGVPGRSGMSKDELARALDED